MKKGWWWSWCWWWWRGGGRGVAVRVGGGGDGSLEGIKCLGEAGGGQGRVPPFELPRRVHLGAAAWDASSSVKRAPCCSTHVQQVVIVCCC